MTAVENAFLIMLDVLLRDAERLRSEDLGFNIPVTAEVVTGYGLLLRLMVRHRNAEEITPEGETLIVQKLALVKKAVGVSDLVLWDSTAERVQEYQAQFVKIATL